MTHETETSLLSSVWLITIVQRNKESKWWFVEDVLGCEHFNRHVCFAHQQTANNVCVVECLLRSSVLGSDPQAVNISFSIGDIILTVAHVLCVRARFRFPPTRVRLSRRQISKFCLLVISVRMGSIRCIFFLSSLESE